MKKRLNRMISLLLIAVICFGILPIGMSASAAAIGEMYMLDLPRGVDPNKSGWGHGSLQFMSGWSSGSSTNTTAKSVGGYEGDTVYCIEPGVSLYTGDNLHQKGEDFWENYPDNLNVTISPDKIKQFIGRIFQYGWTGKNDTSWNSENSTHAQEMGEMLATQYLIWETIVGERDDDFEKVNAPSGKDNILEMVASNHPLRTQIMSHYNRIVSSVQNHVSLPSFMKRENSLSQTFELTWDGSKYSVTLTDTNNIVGKFDFSSTTAGISFSVSGNKLTISTSTPPTGTVDITANKTSSARKATVVWTDYTMSSSHSNQIQDVVSYGASVSDPVKGFVKIKVSTGNLAIVKTTKNNDGKVSGFHFEVRKSDGTLVGTYTSGSDGRISIPGLSVGTYTVKEINLSDEFVQPTPNPVTVEVKAGQTATVSFDNVKKLGIITVEKTNANPVMGSYSLAGAEFEVKNASGTVVDTIKTGSDGKGESEILPLGTYTVYETKAPYGFVKDKNIYTRTLSGSQGTAAVVYCPKITVPEKPQTGKITITKLDAETASAAQGDATLSGAVFDLLDKDGKQVERLYCGTAVSVTSKEVPLGNYTVKEVTPPKGYTLSQTTYPVTIEYDGQDVEVNLKSTNVKNTVIKGKVALVKHTDLPDPDVDPSNPQVEEPLDSAVFQVYLKSAGSYDKAKSSERDQITTDENGYATTKFLPYGTYVVKETKAREGQKLVPAFDVFISTDQKTYPYILNDPTLNAPVKIVKADSETGKQIPYAGAEFKVKNLTTGKWVSQSFNYPVPTTIDTYATAADGTLVMPENLKYGKYELWEVTAPYGYVLSEEPVPFEISDPTGARLTVTMKNAPVKGKVTVEKTGEILTAATSEAGRYGDVYTPVYEVRGIKGAKFNIIASEDIITPDGTVRAKQGEIVDTITTKEDGKAESKELYLGNYHAVEIEVPYGFILNDTPIPFSLNYADQNTALVSAEIGQYNDRTKGEISLLKQKETYQNDQDGKPQYSYVPAEGILFGLYAKEDIINADGEVIIPADSLVDLLVTDTKGKAVSACDIPFGAYYAKELATEKGYILDGEIYEITFDYKDENTPLIRILINEGEAVKNDLIKGKIKVVKTDEGDKPLSGVEFLVTGFDNAVKEKIVTDENGEAETGLLPYGRYIVQETKTGETYVLDETRHVINIIENGRVYEFGLINEKIMGQIKVIKTDGKTKFPLEDVVFELRDAEGTVIAELITDEKGTVVTNELPYGKYTLVEKSTLEEYVLDNTEHEVYIKDHKKIAELELQNNKKSGKIKVFKTDGKTKTPLEGVVFEVFDKDGKLVATITTDKDGIAVTEDLEYGDYTAKEKTAKEGYILDETVHEIQIREHQKVYELTLTNKKTPDTPDVPKTGDNSSRGFWIGLLAVALGALIAFLFIRKKGNGDR